MKAEKGITLVALVITIIVLLILAMVSISIISNHDVISHANNATNDYKEAQQNEIEQLNSVANLMANYSSSN